MIEARSQQPGSKALLQAPRSLSLEGPVLLSGQAPLSADQCRQMVSEAAYFNAEKRGFQPGHDLDDWLAAESEILALAQAAT